MTKLPHRMATWPQCLCRWRADDATNAPFGLRSRRVAPETSQSFTAQFTGILYKMGVSINNMVVFNGQSYENGGFRGTPFMEISI